MEPNELGIVVAVGPEGVRDGTLELAAREALRRGTGVELLHVVHSAVALPAYSGQIQSLDHALLAVGRALLTGAAERLRPRLLNRVPVDTELLVGPVTATIVERSAARQLVVLERRRTEGLDRLLTMSTSSRVAARASAPVVVVPHGWTPSDADLPVTVGVDRTYDPSGQVETAAAYAASAGLEIAVLHAMWLPEAYHESLVDSARQQWMHEADDELRDALDKLELLGQVGEPTRRIRWARPAEALVDESRRSAVLVLSRRPAHGRLGVHLGPVTRTVLRHAACPVLVVDRT